MKRQTRETQRGQVAVLFAIAAVALLAIVGLAVDAGTSYVDQRSLQAGSDTSTTAGATMLAADFHACLSGGSGSLPYTNADISSVVTGIAYRAAAASGRATVLPEVDYVTYTGTILTDVGPVANYRGNLCSTGSGPGTWTGPMGVRVIAGNSHQTLVLQVVGIRNASESATSTATFGVVSGGAYAPFAACDVQPLSGPRTDSGGIEVGDTVLLASPQWKQHESACITGSSDFKGFLHNPVPNPITLPSGSGITTSSTGGGDACGLWPTNIAVGNVVLVPLTNNLTGNGHYHIAVEGLIAVRITDLSCPSVQGVVTTIASAGQGLLICPSQTFPSCADAPFNVTTEATVVQIVD
ncbi:MAG: pilus assembly protein TadG-related protein [Candidatus Dormibacteria bacterium]